jgi:hypothetical protein
MKNSNAKIREKREKAMKITTVVKASVFAAALGIACLLPVTAHAQADVSPDHFELLNTETPAAPPALVASTKDAKADFQGKFSLPYRVQCSGKNLKAGEYQLSVTSEGTNRMIAIHGRGANLNIQARVVPVNRAASQSAVLVRKSGQGRSLEGVYVEALNAMLYLQPSPGLGVMERVPIL